MSRSDVREIEDESRHLAAARLLMLFLVALLVAGCASNRAPVGLDEDEHGDDHEAPRAEQPPAHLVLPALAPVELEADEKLRVVATTSIIGDVAAQAGEGR